MKTFDDIDPQETPAQVLERVKTTAIERCDSACVRAKEMVTKNPVPTVIGALVFGAAVGYLVYSRREHLGLPDLREAGSFRNRLAAGSDRFSSLLHDGYDVASKRAKKASDYVHDIPTDDILHSVSDSLNRVYNRVKFW